MLHLHFAPSHDLLVADLLPLLRGIWTDPFAPPDILVPNPAVGKWLSMRLAEGVAGTEDTCPPFPCIADCMFPTIEHYLWKVLEPDPDMEILDQSKLQQVLCALLNEELVNSKGFEPVRAYLEGVVPGIDPLKRVQLAGRLGHQLLEYEYNRPGVWRETKRKWEPQGIDGAWINRRRYFKDDYPDEPWQAELYRAARQCLCGATADSGGTGTTLLTLPQLYRLRRENGFGDNRPWTVDPATVFMFGVTKVSHFHRNLFVELSQIDGMELQVFLTNPCAEFWEDVNTSRRHWRRSWNRTSGNAGIPARHSDDFDRESLAAVTGTALPADQKLLELWGAAGKENIFLWCQDAQWNFDYHSPAWIDDERPPDTLLAALQYALLRREASLPEPAAAQPDGSLRLLACPDRRREIEEIREQILDLVYAGEVEMLNEVVVYCSDPTPYIPAIQRVFGCHSPDSAEYIPFCILGTSGRQTAFAQGMAALLDILHSRFDRAHIFTLLRNPIVQQTRGITPENITVWEMWSEALSIYRGFNREHRREMGDTGLTLTDTHTFEFGCARLLLGELSEGAALLDFSCSGTGEPLSVIPYRDFDTSDRASLETFCATIEMLHNDGRRLRSAVATSIPTAVAALSDLVNLWLGSIPEDLVTDPVAEGNALRTFYDNLQTIALQQHLAGRISMPVDEFIILARGCLPEESPAGASAWTGGITFAPLRPSMVLPHNVIFAVGLDDVLFPGSGNRPSWDLLFHKRIIGDSDRVRDNRFAFLELLHCARKRLVLSYRSKDMQKESELHPSSTIQELESFLCVNAAAADHTPEQPDSPFRQEIPWIVHESLDVAAAAGRAHGSWNRSEIGLAAAAGRDRVIHRYDLSASVTPGDNATAQTLRTTLYDLRRFFSNPLEYHLARTLGIDPDEPPPTLAAVDEPLESGNLALSIIQNEIITEIIRVIFPGSPAGSPVTADTLHQIARKEALRYHNLHCAAGGAPEALQEMAEKEFLLQWAASCVNPLLSVRERFPDHRLAEQCNLALGLGGLADTLTVELENRRSCSVSCVHQLALVPRDHRAFTTVAIIGISKGDSPRDNAALWLEGCLQWLYNSTVGSVCTVTLVRFYRDDQAKKQCSVTMTDFVPPGGDKAQNIESWIKHLLDEMLVTHVCEHLPFAEIAKFWKRLSLEAIEDDLSSGFPAYRPFLPALELTDAKLPRINNEELAATARARYAPMLDNWLFSEEVVP